MNAEEYERNQKQLIEEKRAMEEIIQSGGCCLLCGYNEDPRILEEHHIAGRKNSDITITVCPNCHRKLSRKQYTWDGDWVKDNNSLLKKIAFLLLGFSVVLMLIAHKIENVVDNLLEYDSEGKN